jgi:hypothetical protein
MVNPLSVVARSFLQPNHHIAFMIFRANLQLLPGETASSVMVNLIDGNNQGRAFDN